MRHCIGCGNEINPLRIKILPTTKTCVACSTTEKKGGVIVTLGEGDHTCNDVIIMDREDLRKIEDLQKNFRRTVTKKNKAEIDPTQGEDLK